MHTRYFAYKSNIATSRSTRNWTTSNASIKFYTNRQRIKRTTLAYISNLLGLSIINIYISLPQYTAYSNMAI